MNLRPGAADHICLVYARLEEKRLRPICAVFASGSRSSIAQPRAAEECTLYVHHPCASPRLARANLPPQRATPASPDHGTRAIQHVAARPC